VAPLETKVVEFRSKPRLLMPSKRLSPEVMVAVLPPAEVMAFGPHVTVLVAATVWPLTLEVIVSLKALAIRRESMLPTVLSRITVVVEVTPTPVDALFASLFVAVSVVTPLPTNEITTEFSVSPA
jgi:hypothetical protein